MKLTFEVPSKSGGTDEPASDMSTPFPFDFGGNWIGLDWDRVSLLNCVILLFGGRGAMR